jgi:hypothetical protein
MEEKTQSPYKKIADIADIKVIGRQDGGLFAIFIDRDGRSGSMLVLEREEWDLLQARVIQFFEHRKEK